jgi:membrane carboxypeptidase/penicillin-binding protein PbpC
VVSPVDGAVFRLAPGADRIPLRSEGAMGLVRWYLDGEFVGAARPGSTPVVALTPGEHRVGLMDERELTAESGFTVVRLKGEGAPILVVR